MARGALRPSGEGEAPRTALEPEVGGESETNQPVTRRDGKRLSVARALIPLLIILSREEEAFGGCFHSSEHCYISLGCLSYRSWFHAGSQVGLT